MIQEKDQILMDHYPLRLLLLLRKPIPCSEI